MANWILITFLIVDILFLNTAGLMLTVAILFKSSIVVGSVDAATMLLLQNTPLGGKHIPMSTTPDSTSLVRLTEISLPHSRLRQRRPHLLHLPPLHPRRHLLQKTPHPPNRLMAHRRVRSNQPICRPRDLVHDPADPAKPEHRVDAADSSGTKPPATTGKPGCRLPPLYSRVFCNTDDRTQFQCCGYLNSTASFAVDDVCPNAMAAANMPGCSGPFSAFANARLDIVFTGLFGIVGR